MTNLLREISTKTRKAKATNKQVVVAYIRVSTEEQKLSVDAQLVELQRYAAANGLTIAASFQDVGVSGGAEIAECDGLQQAISQVQELKAGGLLTLRMDRIARDVRKVTLVEVLLEKAGAKLLLVDGSNSDDPMAQMTRLMSAWMAQQERSLIRVRTKAAIDQLARENKRFTRNAPYGYCFQDDGSMAEDVHEQQGLKLILDLASAGNGPTAIARIITQKGFKARNGKAFNAPTVFYILKRNQTKAA